VRVAALYDVHGNVHALDAVLRAVPDDAAIVVGGDVAAGPFPQQTVDRLRELGDRVSWIRGNADRELVVGEKGPAPPELMEWVRSRLDAESIGTLGGLPPTLTREIDGVGRVLFCHATPENDMDIFTERTPEERVARQFAAVDAELVVCGHTHMQFERTIAGVRVVNSGSVGMPYEDEPGAYWRLDLEPRRTQYDGAEPTASREEAVGHFTDIGL
jgi:predicted phosphodiesterase